MFAIVLVPVAIGMLVRSRSRAFADRMDRRCGSAPRSSWRCWCSASWSTSARTSAATSPTSASPPALFCAISLVVGYVVPRPPASPTTQAIASSMEIGVHNATLAIFVAVEVLDSTEISVPAAVYSLFMFVFATLWGSFISRRVAAEASCPPRPAAGILRRPRVFGRPDDRQR